MQQRKLGNTGIEVSELGFGCASVWGKKFYDEEDAVKLFHKAYDLGINFFDTGSSYDEAEKRLGTCIRQLGAENRDKLVIATKCGTRISESGRYYHDWSVEWMKKSVDISLQRLGTDYLDMLHLHGPAISEITDEVLNFLDDLKRQKIVRATGINSFDTDVLNYVCDHQLFDFVMLDYNIMRQDREELIKRMYENGIGVIGGAALAQSLYSNRIFKIHSKKDVWYFLRTLKNFRGHLVEGREYRFINHIDGFTGNQAALRFVLDNPYLSTAVFGTTSIEHLEENVQAVDKVLPKGVRKKIRTCGRKNNKKLDRQ